MTEPPKILYVVADSPASRTTGGQVRQAALERALSALGSVTLLALDDPQGPDAWTAASERFSRPRGRIWRTVDFAAGHLKGKGPLLHRAECAGFGVAVDEVIAELAPSFVVLGAPLYGAIAASARTRGARVVLDAGESLARSSRSVARSRYLSPGRRLRAALDALAFARLERREYSRADQIWVASDHDARIISGIAGDALVHVIPNPLPREPVEDVTPGEVTAVAFVGSYLHPPNEAAALELIREIMPAVRDRGGPPRAILIGRDPTPAMRRAAERDPLVEITGEVEDVAVPLRAAGLLAVPVRAGAGTRIKILEAAAIGVPVVSTPLGAEGLGLVHERDVLIADTTGALADAIVRVARDGALRALMVRSATRVALAHTPDALRRAVGLAVSALQGPVR
jgi:glycosyltransferase involved in cell wall biosynthesis